MRKQTLLPLCVAAAAILMAGCHRNEMQPSFYQNYDVKFFPDENYTIAAASFSANVRKVIFADRSEVTANGVIDDGLIKSDISYFSWNMPGGPDVTFRLRKKDGAVITNTVTRSAMGDFQLVIDSVFSVTDTIRFSWAGTPLEADEYAVVAFNREYDSAATWDGITDTLFNGQECVLDYSVTGKFRPGVYTVSAAKTRSRQVQQQDGSASGNITVSLYCNRTVIIR